MIFLCLSAGWIGGIIFILVLDKLFGYDGILYVTETEDTLKANFEINNLDMLSTKNTVKVRVKRRNNKADE